ncbi:MAG: tripartite tricarboxylate transporter substrate binding protein [Acetobacteraceae bacterium]|nr:tripartite tricarboxylate transporter substrate binding protein [Acetobacteraceae bacterium]
MHRLLAALVLLLSTTAMAQAAFPDRPITLVVPFAAGGGTDITARTVGKFLERSFGQPVVVANRTGAGGEIGMAAVAEARPDGYTIGIINTPGVVTIPIERRARFSLESFDFIAGVVEDPASIIVLDRSPIRSIADLVAAARANPGAITLGSAGIGSSGHIAMLLLEQAAGVRFTNVPFSGTSVAVTNMLGGQISGTTSNIGEAFVMTAGQPVRILGVMAAKRMQFAPDLVTFAEAGYPIEAGSIRAFGGPHGMPAEVLARYEAAFGKLMSDAEFLDDARRTTQPLNFRPRTELVAALRESDRIHRALWAKKPWNQ